MSPRPRFAALDKDKSASILAAAAEELAERGLEGASYNRIIRRAGVSKGAMYYYFDDKSDLYATAVRDSLERAATAVGEISRFDDAHSFWDALLDLYERVTRFVVDEPLAASLLKVVLSQPSRTLLGKVLAESLEQVEGHFRGVLERGVAVDAVRDDLPVALLSQLTMAIGAVMDRWTLSDWELLTPEELAELPREMLMIHMRVIAPLELLVEWEQDGSRGSLVKENP